MPLWGDLFKWTEHTPLYPHQKIHWLSYIFDRQDKKKSNVEQMKPGEYIEINIGTETEPKMIKIGKGTSKKERNNLINLVKEYRDFLPSLMTSLKHIGKMFSSMPSP